METQTRSLTGKKREDATTIDLVHHRGTLVEGWLPARGEDEGRCDAKAAASGAQRGTGAKRDSTHPPHDIPVPRTAQPRSSRQRRSHLPPWRCAMLSAVGIHPLYSHDDDLQWARSGWGSRWEGGQRPPTGP
jgi:hypothetical protein